MSFGRVLVLHTISTISYMAGPARGSKSNKPRGRGRGGSVPRGGGGRDRSVYDGSSSNVPGSAIDQVDGGDGDSAGELSCDQYVEVQHSYVPPS